MTFPRPSLYPGYHNILPKTQAIIFQVLYNTLMTGGLSPTTTAINVITISGSSLHWFFFSYLPRMDMLLVTPNRCYQASLLRTDWLVSALPKSSIDVNQSDQNQSKARARTCNQPMTRCWPASQSMTAKNQLLLLLWNADMDHLNHDTNLRSQLQWLIV